MRYAAVLGTIGLTELLAHFLSLGWGIMTLLAAFAWVALTGASTAAKARSTEDRLAAVIPVVGTAYTTAQNASTLAGNALPRSGGTVSGSLTVSGGHTVNGTLTANSGILSASMHSTGNVQVDGSHTVNGTLTTFSGVEGASIHVTGSAQVDSQVNAYQVIVNGSRLNMVQGAGGWPVAGGTAWGNPMINALNNLFYALQNSNVIS